MNLMRKLCTTSKALERASILTSLSYRAPHLHTQVPHPLTKVPHPLTQTVRRFSQEQTVQDKIDSMVKSDKVVVFMKGVPDSPRCGFSNAVVQIMRMHGADFKGHDVLADEEVRQGVKDYSSWPTIPQVYFDGEFIGGCDILLQMHQSGELVEELEKIGIKSALITEEEK